MNKIKILLVLGLAMTAIHTPASAQKALERGYRFENVYERNFWLSSWNVAGMRDDSLTISQAAVRGRYAFNDWNAGADAQTILHLENFSMVGSFAFDQKMMYDACGSMFLDPGRYPVDMMEFTPGTKSRQNYAFTGGICVDLGDGWAIGGQLDYSATNYTKRKDLRYSNFALDMSVRPSVVWRSGDLTVGAAFRFDRNTETIKAEQIGASAESYYAFLNKGLFFGLEKVWDSEVLHLSETGINNFPVKNLGYGGALQIGYGSIFAELSYMYGDGAVGEKDATWYKFPTHEVGVTFGYKWISGATQMWARLDGSFQRRRMNEAIIEKTTVGGVTTRQTFGYNNIQNTSSLCITPSFKAVNPGHTEFGVKASWSREDGQSSLKYPAVVGQSLNRYSVDLDGKNIIYGRWDVIVGFGVGFGSLSTNQNIEDSEFPYRQEEYYDNWVAYNTLFRTRAEIGVRYTFVKNIFVEALYHFDGTKKIKNNAIGLNVGYTF